MPQHRRPGSLLSISLLVFFVASLGPSSGLAQNKQGLGPGGTRLTKPDAPSPSGTGFGPNTGFGPGTGFGSGTSSGGSSSTPPGTRCVSIQCADGTTVPCDSTCPRPGAPGSGPAVPGSGRSAPSTPSNPGSVAYNAGIDLYRSGRYAEAEQHFRRAASLLPRDPDPQRMIGKCLQMQAKAMFDRKDLARFEATLGLMEAAARAYETAARLGDRSAHELRQSVEAWLSGARQDLKEFLASQHHVELGIALANQNRLADAETSFKEAIRLNPRNASARYDLALVYKMRGDLAGAEREAREALRVKPDYEKAKRMVAQAVVERADTSRGAPGEIEKLYREAIALHPQDGRAHNNLGVVLQGQGRLREAEAAYREAIRIAPNAAQGHRNLASVLRRQGNHDGALDAYRRAADAEPTPANRRSLAEALLKEASALASSGVADAAVKFYREAARLAPDSPTPHNDLGVLLYRTGRFNEAATSFRAAIQANPADVRSRMNLALALERLGQRDAAAAEYRRTAELAPADPEVRAHAQRVAIAAPGSFASPTGAAVPTATDVQRLEPFPRGSQRGAAPEDLAGAIDRLNAIFDKGGHAAPSFPRIELRRSDPPRDPIVPPKLKTHPTISALERQRDAAREELRALETQRAALEQSPGDAARAAITRIDEHRAAKAQQVTQLNETITEEVRIVILEDR